VRQNNIDILAVCDRVRVLSLAVVRSLHVDVFSKQYNQLNIWSITLFLSKDKQEISA